MEPEAQSEQPADDTTRQESADDAARSDLLADAEAIADLPLEERPQAFERLNDALATELQELEEA